MSTAEISAKHVGMVYRDRKGEEVTALQDVSFDIEKGEFISLLGPSGCGKSTLLRIIADLLAPTSGEITIGGETPEQARKKLKYGMVFQSPVLYDWRTVRENVRLPLQIMHLSRAEQDSRISEMLELVGLTAFADHYPKQLSGGMQQRVGIARALAIQPDILLMDEPFSALDEFTKEKLQDDLLHIWRKTNKTIIFVTHSIAEAVYLSDRIFVLSPHPGRLTAIEPIPLVRPRTDSIRNSAQFFELVGRIRNDFEGGSI